MTMYYFKILIAGVLLSLSYTGTTAQVTIGSGYRPNPGSLLDLKEKDNKDGLPNSTRGLGLPRLSLNGIHDLTVEANVADPSNYTGLIVYHVTKDDDKCKMMPSGVYAWNGRAWEGLGVTPKLSIRPENEFPMTTKRGLEQPNSYIVSQPGVLKIPIEKAIKVWDGSSWKGDTEAGSGTMKPLLSSPQDVSRIELKASLLWTDYKEPECKELIINADSLKIKGTGDDRYIELWVGNAKGNAVVTLSPAIGDHVLWSWHIWATDEPKTANYNNGNTTLTFMDRNLGATSAVPGDSATIGFYYQGGRKDPFPSVSNWGYSRTVIYNDGNNEIDPETNKIASTNSDLATDESHLVYSINNPLSFITGDDWYSAEVNNTDRNSRWLNRWGADGTKSASDPCPEGWKVPVYTGGSGNYPWDSTSGTHPWDGLNTSNFVSVSNGRTIDGVDNSYYPFSGRLTDQGSIDSVGNNGFYHTATNHMQSDGYFLEKTLSISAEAIEPSQEGYSYANPVRCVKE